MLADPMAIRDASVTALHDSRSRRRRRGQWRPRLWHVLQQ